MRGIIAQRTWWGTGVELDEAMVWTQRNCSVGDGASGGWLLLVAIPFCIRPLLGQTPHVALLPWWITNSNMKHDWLNFFVHGQVLQFKSAVIIVMSSLDVSRHNFNKWLHSSAVYYKMIICALESNMISFCAQVEEPILVGFLPHPLSYVQKAHLWF